MSNLTKLRENSKEQRQAILEAKSGNITALVNLLKASEALIVSRILELGYVLDNNNFENLIQEGKIGIIEAINAFDLDRGTAFSTYAVTKIDKCLRRCKSDKTTVHITEYQKQKLSQYSKTYDELVITWGRIPTTKELSDILNVNEEKIIEYQKLLSMKSLSLNKIIPNLEGEETLEYFLKDQQYNSPDILYIENNLEIKMLNVLAESDLTNEEIIVLLLRFGINTPSNKEYTLKEISTLFGITIEAVRIKEKNAIDRLRNNSALLNLIEYSQNPSLVLRKLKIKKAIRKTPYSKEYPDIYSFFPEYTIDEIKQIIDSLPFKDKEFLNKLGPKYHKNDSIYLYEIINHIYNELISTFGRRPLTSYEINTEINCQTNSKANNKRLNRIYTMMDSILNPDYYKENYTFWDYLENYDKELLKRSLMYITDDEYKLLVKRYGTKLDKSFIKYEDDTNEIEDLLDIWEIIEKIVKYNLLLKDNKELVSNIYLYFNKYPKNLIDKAINKLSITDKTILHKRFGPNLKEPYNELELVRLTSKEYVRLSKIIYLLEKDLINEYNLIKAKNTIDIPQTIYSIFSAYDKNIVTYAISKLNNTNREIICNLFGSNIAITFNELKEKKFNQKELDNYNKNTIQGIKYTLTKLKKLNIEDILKKEKRKFEQNIQYIYIDELVNSNNNLFEEEKEILAKAISIGIDNISTLPTTFQLAFYGIINRITKEYRKKEEYNNTLSSILNNYNPNPANIENSMILFLYLGIGRVEPVSISIISKTFNLEESTIKEIILLELNTLKEKLILKNTSYNNLVKQLKAK